MCVVTIVFAGCLISLFPLRAVSQPAAMKGPVTSTQIVIHEREPETSSIKLVFLAAIELFQKRISPTDGPRCGFTPTCSAFGHQAVRDYGPVRGVLMTADRLMRDTFLTELGPGYILLPDGRIFDPPSANLLDE